MASLQTAAAYEMNALNREEDSDDMELSTARDVELPGASALRSGHRRMWPMVLAGVLGLAALAAVFPWQSSKQTVQVQAEPQEKPRLLESDELVNTVLEHALRFHDEMSGETYDASHERDDLKRAARDRLQDMLHKVTSHSPEAGRLLSDLRLTKDQWGQSKQILNALHDKRVQNMGEVVREAAGQSQNPREANVKLGAREEELRKLREELIPEGARGVAAIPEGQNHWGFAMQKGEFHAQGPVGDWQGALTIGGSETERRLMDKGQLIYLIITATIVTILGIVSTVLTLTLGPAAASILFIVTAGIDGVLCGTSIGLTHLPNFKNVATWIPCLILSSFTGVEAIWTYQKGGAAAAAAAATTTAPPAAPPTP